MPWTPWGSNGRAMRHTFRSSLPNRMKRGIAGTARWRRYLPFDPHTLHGMTTTKEFRASARPPWTLMTPLFVRHSRQITTLNRVFCESGDRSCWRSVRIMAAISALESLDQGSCRLIQRNRYTSTRQGQPIGINLTYGQMPAPLIAVSV